MRKDKAVGVWFLLRTLTVDGLDPRDISDAHVILADEACLSVLSGVALK